MTDVGAAALACVAGPLLVGGVMAVKAKRKRAKDQPKRARPVTRTALARAAREEARREKHRAANSLSLAHDMLTLVNVPDGRIGERVAWLIQARADLYTQLDKERTAHAAVLRDRDADAAMLQRDIRELLQPPSGVELGPISSVKCLLDAYATLRAEMRKTQPAVVVAVEGALWHAWGQEEMERRRDVARLFSAFKVETTRGTDTPTRSDLFSRVDWPEFVVGNAAAAHICGNKRSSGGYTAICHRPSGHSGECAGLGPLTGRVEG